MTPVRRKLIFRFNTQSFLISFMFKHLGPWQHSEEERQAHKYVMALFHCTGYLYYYRNPHGIKTTSELEKDPKKYKYTCHLPVSSVGIATAYVLDGPGIEYR